MPEYINYNGKILSADEPVLTSDNRSFSYGDGIFETIRLSNGKILFFDDHFARLQRGADFLRLELPEYFNKDFLQHQIFETAESNEISMNGRVKVTVFRSGKGKYEPETDSGHWVINISPLYRPDYLWNENGLNLGIFEKAQKPCDESSNYKTTSSLIYVLAAVYKKESGFDESILLNTKGNVADAIYANVFMVKDKKIYTPSLSEGSIDGVMRKQILKLAKKAGFKSFEEVITLDDLKNSDEIFLTNSVKGVIWINNFSGKIYDCNTSNKLIEHLNDYIG
jgi:branched-chain amino acid aminotransferase